MSSSPPAQPVDEAPTPGSDNNDNVFGGASDAGSDNGAPANTADDPAPTAEEGGGDAPEGSGGEGADAYVPATATSAARIPSFKKRRGSGDEDGEGDGDDSDDDDDEERQRRKKKRKERRERRAQEEEEEELPVLDEATQRRHALEERIDNIGKKQRVMRRKKKGGEDVDIVDSYHDEVCIRLRDRMLAAAAKDISANTHKLPATSKLAMLNEVVDALQNTTLWSAIVDNEVLKAVKQWLEPLPDKSLPAVGIQKAFFEVLPKMDLDTSTVREAQIGAVVLFYTKTKRVTPAINRQAEALVQVWSRPIIKRSADFRSRYVARADDVEMGGEEVEGEDDLDVDGDGEEKPRRKRQTAAKPRRFDVRQAVAENADRKGARPLIANEIQYSVAPESRLRHHEDDLAHVSRIQMDNKKFNRFARQLQTRKR